MSPLWGPRGPPSLHLDSDGHRAWGWVQSPPTPTRNSNTLLQTSAHSCLLLVINCVCHLFFYLSTCREVCLFKENTVMDGRRTRPRGDGTTAAWCWGWTLATEGRRGKWVSRAAWWLSQENGPPPPTPIGCLSVSARQAGGRGAQAPYRQPTLMSIYSHLEVSSFLRRKKKVL